MDASSLAYVIDWAQFDDTLGVNSRYRIHRDRLMGRRRHTHRGFEELFIVESGSAVHDLNGRDHGVAKSDVVFVRTSDVHRFRSCSNDFVLVNVSMPVGTMGNLHRRYCADVEPMWDRDPRQTLPLAPLQVERLVAMARNIRAGAVGAQAQLAIDRFFIELFTAMSRGPGDVGSLPQWLSAALDKWADDRELMADGMAALARVAGRSRAHVARVLRQSSGQPSIAVLNWVRMTVAADRLELTDDPIPLIAADVGLSNLSHFYRVFRGRYGTTPRRYRASHRDAPIAS